MLHLEINVKRRHIYALVAAFAVILTIMPLASYAADKFNDVPDSNIFHNDIAWLADAGVTKGCNPPANDEFCPGSSVTREQMAAFMRRLAENKVVDAATAVDADTVDGLDASDLMARWALVAADGTIVDQSGGITMTSSFDGGYYLNFGSSVEGHAIFGTIKYRNATPGNSDGTLNLSPCGALGTTCAVSGTNNTDHVWVLTRDGSGTQDGRPFYITVLP